MDISVKDYMSMQPNYPKVADSDKYYLQMTLRLAEAFDRTGLFANIDESTRRNVVLAVIGYYQDVVSDCGIWRSFITIHKQVYGSPLPFYNPDDNYCESEMSWLESSTALLCLCAKSWSRRMVSNRLATSRNAVGSSRIIMGVRWASDFAIMAFWRSPSESCDTKQLALCSMPASCMASRTRSLSEMRRRRQKAG